jgi:hypothetical protein
MKRYALLVAPLLMLWATETMANNIGFDNLGGNNLDSFTSYEEDGYTVSAESGSWHVAKVFGNEIPAIFAGPIGSPGLSQISVTYEGEGQFTFGGVDLTSNSAGGTAYTIAGFLNGGQAFTPFTVQIDSINTFETRLFSSLENVNIDRLTITGTPGQGTTSFNIDNIRAGNGGAPLPEPASLLLLGAGLAGIGIWRLKPAKIEKGV